MRKIFYIGLVLITLLSIGCTIDSPYPETMYTRDIIPGLNNTYTLGDNTHLWNYLYVTNGAIGSLNVGGNITVGGTVDGVDISTLAGSSHTQNTDWILKQSNGGADLINSATLKSNLAVDGGVTVDGVDVSGHEARHEFKGADELSIKNLMLVNPPTYFVGEYGTSLTTTVTGTGGGWTSKWAMENSTGATNGSTSGKVFTHAHYHAYSATAYRDRIAFRIHIGSATTQIESWAGAVATNNVFPTVLSKHFAMRVLSTDGTNAILQATCGDGATAGGTQTTLLASVINTDTIECFIIYGALNIKYYYSLNGGAWTLGATHTTTRPDWDDLYYGLWVKNTSAANRTVKMESLRVLKGPE